MHLFFIVFLVVLGSFSVKANIAGPTTRFEHISLEQGLSQVSVLDILQDSKGFIWIATQDGLNRYDGYDIKVFRHDRNHATSITASYINTLFEDSKGQLWVGTAGGGVVLYNDDTESFKQLISNTSPPSKISTASIRKIAEDCKGNLWFATTMGIYRYEVIDKTISHFQHDPNNPNSLSDNSNWALAFDNQCGLWIASWAGLNYLSPEQQYADKQQSPDIRSPVFIHNQYQASNPNSINSKYVLDLATDKKGHLWVATTKGLNSIKINPQANRAHNRYHFTKYDSQVGNSYLRSVMVDNQNRVWAGSTSDGLFLFDSDLQTHQGFKHIPENSHSLSNDNISAIYQDKQGLIWVGSFYAGVNKLNTSSWHFNHYRSVPNESNSLSNNIVNHFLVDKTDNLWVATRDGLNHFNTQAQTVIHYHRVQDDSNSISHSRISQLFEDSQGNIWIGTANGLNRLNKDEQTFERLNDNPLHSPNCLDNSGILSMFEDSKKTLWLGTRFGLCYRKDGSNTFARLPIKNQIWNSKNELYNFNITAITEYPPGNYWIGSNGSGLIQYNSNNNTFLFFLNQSTTPFEFKEQRVYSIVKTDDISGQTPALWFGSNGGLSKYEVATNKLVHYDLSTKVLSLLTDQQNDIWLSSNNGLYQFDPVQETFRHFGVKDGLQSSEFNSRSAYKSPKGELFFGGVNGFNRFFPKDIQFDTTLPQIVITDLLLANQPVTIASTSNSETTDNFTLNKAIDNLAHITLSYKQNLVTFEFAALHFGDPMRNQYAYRLDGQDDNWIYTDAKNRRATYTNLPAGDYKLRIKASNHQQLWQQKEKILDITVLPPPWKTWWAYTLYTSIILSIIASFVHMFIKSQRQFIRSQQQKVADERRLNKKLKQLDKLKDQFLANTSHELRTPLNGIIGLSESMIDGATGALPNDTKANLSMVVASGRRLANLVNDILDFQKLKNHNLVLHRKPVDIYSLAQVVLTLSKPLMGDKSVKLINSVSKELPCVFADENRLEQIFHNLISNAIKFTEQGSITLSAELTGDTITISIADTGIGIDSANLDLIFHSFEQIETHTTRHYSGTGLGLAVTKQLVELHGGQIEVTSTIDVGTTMAFTLPLSDEVDQTKQKHSNTLNRLNLSEEDINPTPTLPEPLAFEPKIVEATQQSELTHQAFKLLVVDDEPVNRQVVKNFLALQDYQLVEADNGEQALALLDKQGPFDLVLLDIMMPKISGYEVCQQLRDVHSASDLPIIFLSAKNQVTDLTQSFALGGNDYLCKPVSKHELLARVETHLNMLDIHRNLEEKVKQRTLSLQQSLEQLKAAQEQLLEAEKMAALGNLVAGVAHEVNTPLGICITMVSLNIERLNSFAEKLTSGKVTRRAMDSYLTETQECESMVERNLHRAAALIQEFKKVAVEQSDHNQAEIVFHEHLNEVIKSLQTQLDEKHISLTMTSEGQWKITTYPGAWVQIIESLCNNASLHAFADKHEGKITISAERDDEKLRLTFIDDGCGMDEAQLENLYEPFYTTIRNQGGTGLGMNIVYNLVVHKLKGKINCQSEVGKGTSYCIEVPIDNN